MGSGSDLAATFLLTVVREKRLQKVNGDSNSARQIFKDKEIGDRHIFAAKTLSAQEQESSVISIGTNEVCRWVLKQNSELARIMKQVTKRRQARLEQKVRWSPMLLQAQQQEE